MTIVALEDAADPGTFGGKAAQLATAIRSGLSVPPGLALSRETAALVAAGDDEASRVLEEALAAISGERFAVRSSALEEDSAAASFAGQHTTCLNIPRDRIADAIGEVWRSAAAAHTQTYRHRLGVEEHATGTSVVVQTLIPAEVAGVLFTRDPVTGADERVIEASWGFGEAVVAGHVVPDRYRLTRGGTVIERRPGLKDQLVAGDDTSGTTLRAVTGEAISRLCLDDHNLAQLAALAHACETAFAGPLDIEWALTPTQLWLLQARPITTSR